MIRREADIQATNSPSTVLDYYQGHRLNPVPIALEDQGSWESHFRKRLNLYQRHLGIPLSLLRNRSVVEFGCNSGENALVLASMGADLTLVEPNEQVIPRLRGLFKQFHLEDRISELVHSGIDDFQPDGEYDVVIAEGFLYTLPNRDELLLKLARLVAPGGLAIITLNDKYGGLLELTKAVLLRRACQLSGVEDVHSEASLALAKQLYYEDFRAINASRPFDAWWGDALVNEPVTAFTSLWSFPELIPLVDKGGCEFYSSSPRWAGQDNLDWYKNVRSREERHTRLLESWGRLLPYFLTGLPAGIHAEQGPPQEVLEATTGLVSGLSAYALSGSCRPAEFFAYPTVLDRYLGSFGDPFLTQVSRDLQQLYGTIAAGSLQELVDTYHGGTLRKLWGTPVHYLCFTRDLPPPFYTGGSRQPPITS